MIKICETCGCEFVPRKQYESTARFCSRKCFCVWGNRRQTELGTRKKKVNAHMFGNQYRKGLAPTNVTYRRGEEHQNWKPRLKFTCKMCGNEFERVRWQTTKPDSTNEYCSVACRAAYKKQYLSGKNAPDYLGGPLTYRGRGWHEARKPIVERQNGCCATCGKYVGDSLPVHHIRPFREFDSPEAANDPSNLVGLCQSCHMKQEPRPRFGRTE